MVADTLNAISDEHNTSMPAIADGQPYLHQHGAKIPQASRPTEAGRGVSISLSLALISSHSLLGFT